MTIAKLVEKLTDWTDNFGWTDDVLNDFVNINASSYEEYMAIWEIVEQIKLERE